MKVGTILKHRQINYYSKIVHIRAVEDLFVIGYIKCYQDGVPLIKKDTPVLEREMKTLMQHWKIWT